MRIEAAYFDGFTERLLRWKLVVNDGKAYLEADWFRNPSPLRERFRFDEAPFRSSLPLISGMEEDYRPPWEDLEDRSLVVEVEGATIRRHVYGASLLVKEHPEIEGFLTLWRLLDEAVEAHLPAKMRGRTRGR